MLLKIIMLKLEAKSYFCVVLVCSIYSPVSRLLVCARAKIPVVRHFLSQKLLRDPGNNHCLYLINFIKLCDKKNYKVVTAATLLTPTIALLKKDGANFKSWYRTVTIKLSNYKLLNLFDKDNKLSKEQNGQLIEFLFAVVEPVVLDMLKFDESIDQVHVLWNELTKFGESKRAIKLESLEEDLDSLFISDPRKAKDLLDKLESTFQALEDMGQPLSEKSII